MENLTRSSVEVVLVLACCLIISPTVTTPTEDLRLSSKNDIPVSEFHYPAEETSDGDEWNFNYPGFPFLLQEKLPETKRRSSFFPVRGKKPYQNVHLPNAKSETLRGYAFYPESTRKNGPASFPAVRTIPHSPYDLSQDGQRFSNEIQRVLENSSVAVGSTGSLDWLQTQKRRSSFMPMRGRKRSMNGHYFQLAKRYMPSTLHDDLEDSKIDEAVNKATNEDETYGKDKIYPRFPETANKDVKLFLDKSQFPKSIKFVKSNSGPVNIEEIDASSLKSFFSDKNIPTKRALSFVPTRGRRGKLDSFVPEILPQVAMLDTFGESRAQDVAIGQSDTNLSPYMRAAEDKTHERYRRVSAFLPMRGRRSSGRPYWIAYNYLPHSMRTSDYLRSRVGNMEEGLSQTSDSQGPIYSEDKEYTGGRRQKKSYDEGSPQPTFSQKLRTAVVMKRPSLSFFAARGKRWNGDGKQNVF